MARIKPKKVAIVCDWLTTVGGAERVVKSLHELFPDAPIYTSQYDPVALDWFQDADVRTGWLNRLPRGMHKFFPLLRCWYFSRLNLLDYDLVISSTGAEAKAVHTRPDALHISYIHAPTQYYWSLYDDYLKNPGFGWLNPVMRLALKLLVRPMRSLDKRFAARPDVIVANSSYVRDDIRTYYGRDSTVIFPPVNTALAEGESPKTRHGFVTTSRQVPWKRLDIAVAACRETGDSLVVVGGGSEHERLVALAEGAANIRFIPTQNDRELARILQRKEGFLFPSKEPFGIAPVEALAVGTPVIAYGAGGALDYVQDGVNGLLFDEQSVTSLVAALKRFRTVQLDPDDVQRSAARFSDAHFKQAITKLIAAYERSSS